MGELKEIFGWNLRRILTERNIRQTEIASAMNVGRSCVAKWCNGRSYPDVPTLVKLVCWLDIPVQELFRE